MGMGMGMATGMTSIGGEIEKRCARNADSLQ